MSTRQARLFRARVLYLSMILALVLSVVPQALPGVEVPAAEAHNLQTRMVYMFFDPDTQACLDARLEGTALPAGCAPLPIGWAPGDPVLQADDELGVIIKVVPRDGTTTGVGGHIDFYVPNGVQVVDVGYMVPDGVGGFEKTTMKGQSPIAIGAGPVGAKSTAELIGLSANYTSAASGLTAAPVTAAGLHRGTIAGVYGDTGIFFSTDPDTAYGSWQAFTGHSTASGCGSLAFNPTAQGERITNNSGDVVVPCNKWDAEQLFAWGAKGTTYGAAALRGGSTAIVDYPDQRGNAPWGFASGVAGPDSGYAWHFDWDAYKAAGGNPLNPAHIQAAMGTNKIGPWQRIQYDGDRVSFDQPGLISSVLGYASKDAGNLGAALPLATTTDQTTTLGGPKAIRWAVGQLTAFRPEYAWVKIRVTDATAGITGPGGCPDLRGDTFGGDAGGTDNGKDHLWRYYEPTEVKMNMCLAAGKPATKEFVKSGATFQYPLKVYNLQGFTLTNVQVRDTLGAGLTFVSSAPAQNSGPNPLVWNVGTLLPGQKFEALVTVRTSSTGYLDNCVVITSDQLPPQSACDTTISGAYPFLIPTKTARTTSLAAGGTVIYDVLVRNIGEGPTGSPVTIREFLPDGFTYDPTFTPAATVNGAAVTPTVNAANPSEPIFTIPTSLQAGQRLTIAFRAKVDPATDPGSYCNAYSTTQNGVPITTGSLACVTVAGGRIGDTIWRDWNGNGVQDAGEEGIAGVTVKLYAADGTTLLATTTTDANGNYSFPGLVAGTYVVEVNNGNPLPGTVQTGDPDQPGVPCTTCDNRHTVVLATDQQYLDADFGYRPTGSASIGDKVFEDISNNGLFDTGVDFGIPNVTVWLYEDSNNDGVIDAGDALVATTVSNVNGDYLFSNLAPGFNYLVKVDKNDPDIQTYFNNKYGASTLYQLSTPEVSASPNLSGADLDNDFGFWRVLPGSIGDQVFIDNNGNGIFDAGDAPLAGVTVNLYLNGVLVATTSTGPDGTYLFPDLGPGNYQVVVDATDPELPGGYFPTVKQFDVALTAGQNFLTADFPFISVLSKTVNLSYATPGQTLNFTLKPYYPGPELMENVRIIDPLPAGTTYVGSSANAGGVFGPYVSLPGEPGEDPVPAVGMGIYNNNNDTFRYRTFNTDSDDLFSAELSGANMGTRIQMMAGASSPTTAERVIAFTHGGPQISAAIWNGTAWAAVPNPPAGASGRLTSANLTTNSNLYWGAAVAYEQSSGHLMLVWNDDTSAIAGTDDELRYVTRESGVWGTVTSLPAGNQPQNLRMAARPNSDQLALVYSTAAGADYVRIWSGTAWGSETALDTSGGSLTSVNVAYEAQSGRAMVVYGKPTATSVNLFYRVWDGSSWSAEASITPPAGVTTQPQWVAIASDPFSDRIAVGVVTSGGRTWLAVWNGTAWVNVEQATATSLIATAQNVAVSFETLSGDLLAAYGVNSAPTAQVRYRAWSWNPLTSTGSWSAEQAGPSATNGNPNVITLARSPSTDRVMMTINTSSSRANYVFWDGSAWDTTVTEAAGNTQTATQQPAIFLWNRASATESAATSVIATPATAALGGAITVKLALKPISAIPNATPILEVVGGSAICTTADTIPANLAAGVVKTFTYTCTPSTLGEFRFIGEATSSGGYEFPVALSNSVLVSNDGSSNIVTWNLGSNESAVAGETIDSGVPAGIYAFRGAATTTFRRFGITSGVWADRAVAPATIAKGGALTSDGVATIYALRGNTQQTFYSYNSNTDAWTTLTNTGVAVNEGGALVFLNVGGTNYVYALMGNSTSFRRYNVSTPGWTALAATPANVKKGGALATDGTYIYALRGDRKNSFWRCNATTTGSAGSCDTSWTTLAVVPGNVGWGGSLARVGGFVYAMQGDGKTGFYRYNIATDAWTAMASTPGNVSEGGALATDGVNIYAFQGKTTAFWRYNIATNSWTVLAPFSAATGQGGALTYLPSVNAQGRTTSISATPVLVSTGGTVQVVMRVASNEAIGSVTPTALTPTATGGATAICTGPTPASQAIAANGTADFTWSCAVTPGATPGSLKWSASADGTSPTRTFPSATSNSVLVSPVLSFSATVDSPAPASGVINNTGIMLKSGPEPNVFPSNTTQTATSGSIGDRVWNDADGDGIQDAGEPGLAGVKVYIDSNNNGQWDPGEPYDITDVNGNYRIFNLSAATYTVRTDPATYPAGFVPSTPATLSVNLGSGQQYNDADFGLKPPGTGRIGDYIWLDADNDGVQDGDEDGLPGITVTLEIWVGGQWVALATTTTDANGGYEFTSLSAGQYRVTVDPNSPVTSPYGPVSTLGAAMVATYDKDGGTVTPNGQTVVTLATDSTVVNDVDFGYNWSGSIGDYVWWDDNRNGVPDGGEMPIANAVVLLYFDANGDGILNPAEGDYQVDFTMTDANGAYSFANLPPGPYLVEVYDDSITTDGNRNIVPTTAPVQYVNLAAGQTYLDADFGYYVGARVAGSVFHDDDRNAIFDVNENGLAGITVTLTGTDMFGNPVSATTTTDADGNFFFVVPEGDYTLSYNTTQTTAAGFPDATTVTSFTFHAFPGEDWQQVFEFGVDYAGKVGDRVWNDANGDGAQNAGEPGIGGVTVELYASDGVTLLAVTATDGNGNYLFEGLPDGTYVVKVVPATLPSGFAQTYDNFGPTNDHTGRGVVSGGGSDLTADFGYRNLTGYNVSGVVWDDQDGNGAQNGGEPGLPGVTVCLVDSNNVTVACVVTDANGGYSFPGVPNGNYTIRVDPDTLPNGAYAPTYDPNGISTPHVTSITVNNANVVNQNFGYQEQLGSISGTVCPGNGDGQCDDPGEYPGIAGVTVFLTWAGPDGILGTDDDVVTTTTTNANGDYTFPDLQPGLYVVTKVNPSGYTSLADADGGNPNAIYVNLGVGQDRTDRDFEVQPARGAIGDRVWLDTDGDGVQDIGEPGLANVTVYLCTTSPCTSGNATATATTDANGNYLFADVSPGTYYVGVDPTTLPAGLTASPGSFLNTTPITLAAGQSFLDADFGYRPAAGTAVIGDFVWADANGNGIQDPGEIGIAGVPLALKDSAGNTVATTTTGPDGSYLFTNVAPGSYTVQVTTPPAGYTPTSGPQSEGGNVSRVVTVRAGDVVTTVDFGYDNPNLYAISDTVWFDANRDGILDPTESGIGGVTVNLLDSNGDVIATVVTNPDGTFTFSGVPDGNYTIQIADNGGQLTNLQPTTPSAEAGQRPVVVSGGDVTGVNFGYAGLGPIGDTIWSDANGNGVQDPGEIGIGGVTVRLYYDSNGNGVYDPATDALIAATVTDASGYYLFDNLPAGTFFVVVDQATLPVGYVQTGDPDGTLDHRTTVTLTSTEVSFLDADFGYRNNSLADVSGTVWNDINNNAQQNPGEPGIAVVTVCLVDNNGVTVGCTVTDSNGDYTFFDVPPGNYTVVVTDQSSVLNGFTLTSGLDAIPVTVVGNTSVTDVDFGYVRNPATGAIGDTVWYDANRDGVRNGAEDGISNVTVTLKAAAPVVINGVSYNAGDTIATTVTDLNGDYLFSGLPAGSYTVTVDETTLPNGGTGLAATTGTVNPTATINLSQGQVYLDADFGYASPSGTMAIGDFVWHDVNGDGIQDPGEPGIGGVTITVTGPSCLTGCTTVTAADGSYLVAGLEPGTYAVTFTPPAGYNPHPTNYPANTTGIELASSPRDILYADFGFTGGPTGAIGDRIWLDVDGDGVQDGGEPGIPGVTVNLVNNNGVVIATTTTDANGNYLFSGVPNGNYTVVVSDVNNVLAGNVQTGDPDQPGVPCTTCDNQASVTVSGGATVDTIDFGYQPAGGVIGNQVWHDQDGDGLRDAGEPGIQGVTIALWLDVNGDGVITPGVDNLVRTTVTDVNGQYALTGLPYGKYLVDVTDTSGVLTGFNKTTGPNPGNDNNSQADPYAVTLNAGSPTNYTADFGYTAPGVGYSISGTVFNDLNNNGHLVPTQELGEPPLPGTTVLLYRQLPDGSLVLIGTTVSDISGAYLFPDLPPGNYVVATNALSSTANGFFQTTQAGPSNPVQQVTIVDANRVQQDFGYYQPPVAPLSIDLDYFTATVQGNNVLLEWVTMSETTLLGFNLYRAPSPNGPWSVLNSAVIPAQSPGSTAGNLYTWSDNGLADGVYWYRLDGVETTGTLPAAYAEVQVGMSVRKMFLPLIIK